MRQRIVESIPVTLADWLFRCSCPVWKKCLVQWWRFLGIPIIDHARTEVSFFLWCSVNLLREHFSPSGEFYDCYNRKWAPNLFQSLYFIAEIPYNPQCNVYGFEHACVHFFLQIDNTWLYVTWDKNRSSKWCNPMARRGKLECCNEFGQQRLFITHAW